MKHFSYIRAWSCRQCLSCACCSVKHITTVAFFASTIHELSVVVSFSQPSLLTYFLFLIKSYKLMPNNEPKFHSCTYLTSVRHALPFSRDRVAVCKAPLLLLLLLLIMSISTCSIMEHPSIWSEKSSISLPSLAVFPIRFFKVSTCALFQARSTAVSGLFWLQNTSDPPGSTKKVLHLSHCFTVHIRVQMLSATMLRLTGALRLEYFFLCSHRLESTLLSQFDCLKLDNCLPPSIPCKIRRTVMLSTTWYF